MFTNVDIIIPHTAPTATVLISSTIDQDAADESWGFRDFYLWIESTEECAFFYSECYFKGESVEYCRESRNSLKTEFLPKIKSFKIPANGKVNLFSSDNFEQKTMELTGQNECIQDDSTVTSSNGRLLFEYEALEQTGQDSKVERMLRKSRG